MENPIILRQDIIDCIKETCARNNNKNEFVYDDLSNDLKKYAQDNYALVGRKLFDKYHKGKNLSITILKRALSRSSTDEDSGAREDLRNLLCLYAYKLNWENVLKEKFNSTPVEEERENDKIKAINLSSDSASEKYHQSEIPEAGTNMAEEEKHNAEEETRRKAEDETVARKKAEEEADVREKSLTKEYNVAVAKANKMFLAKNYSDAKKAYHEALTVKPSEQYPKDKIAEIDKILVRIALKKNVAIISGLSLLDLTLLFSIFYSFYFFGITEKTIIWSKKGEDFYKNAEYRKALTAYTSATETEPNYTLSWYYIADIFYRYEEYDDAIEASEKFIQLKPDTFLGWYIKGVTLLHQKKFRKAWIALDRAIELNKENPELWSDYGRVLFKLGEIENSLNALRKSRDLNPSDSKTWYEISCIFYHGYQHFETSFLGIEDTEIVKDSILENLSQSVKLDDLAKVLIMMDKESFKLLRNNEYFKSITEINLY